MACSHLQPLIEESEGDSLGEGTRCGYSMRTSHTDLHQTITSVNGEWSSAVNRVVLSSALSILCPGPASLAALTLDAVGARDGAMATGPHTSY